MKFNQRLYRLPVSRRRVFNAMNVAINNNFERIDSPRLERGQYKVKNINGFTKPLPIPKIEFRITDPNPVTNPATDSFPTPGTNPEITVTFYEPNPGIDPAIYEEPNDGGDGRPGTPGTPGGSGWRQKTACLIGIVVIVDSSGNITHFSTSGDTTNNLDLKTLLEESGKVPTTAGTYNFVFEFFGWKRDANHLDPSDPNYHDSGWSDDDNKYNIYEGSQDQFLITNS